MSSPSMKATAVTKVRPKNSAIAQYEAGTLNRSLYALG
jgi:hypothetical protein